MHQGLFFLLVLALKHLNNYPCLLCLFSFSPVKAAPKKLLLNPFRGLDELDSEAVEIFI